MREGEIVLKRRFVADSGNPRAFSGRAYRVACDQSLARAQYESVDGEPPVRVDSTILSSDPTPVR